MQFATLAAITATIRSPLPARNAKTMHICSEQDVIATQDTSWMAQAIVSNAAPSAQLAAETLGHV
jgi:hypothetical protein